MRKHGGGDYNSGRGIVMGNVGNNKHSVGRIPASARVGTGSAVDGSPRPAMVSGIRFGVTETGGRDCIQAMEGT